MIIKFVPKTGLVGIATWAIGVLSLFFFAERPSNPWTEIDGKIVSAEVQKGQNPMVPNAEFVEVYYVFQVGGKELQRKFESGLCHRLGCGSELLKNYPIHSTIKVYYKYDYQIDINQLYHPILVVEPLRATGNQFLFWLCFILGIIFITAGTWLLSISVQFTPRLQEPGSEVK